MPLSQFSPRPYFNLIADIFLINTFVIPYIYTFEGRLRTKVPSFVRIPFFAKMSVLFFGAFEDAKVL